MGTVSTDTCGSRYSHCLAELDSSSTSRSSGDRCQGNTTPQWKRASGKLCPAGVIAGFPVVDLKATLVDGSSHSVDSSGIAFEIAGNQALSKGVREAKPTLLEPVLRATITVPDSYSGDIIGDLNGKRGKILGMNPQGDGTSEIEAEVPQSEMRRYATDLRSQTQGRGSFTVEYDHYEEVPAHLVERVVDETREREEAKV